MDLKIVSYAVKSYFSHLNNANNMKLPLSKRPSGLLILVVALVGGLLFYQPVFSQTFSTVTTISVESKADCNEATFKVKYKVDNPSPNGGYIVQKVDLKGYRIKCDLTSNGRVNLVYFECWPVPPNSDSTTGGPPETGTTSSGQTWNDQYTMGPLNNTFGEMSWQGEVGFIANPSASTSAIDTTWTRTGVPNTGGLLGTTTTPGFWAAMVASGATSSHDAYTSWYCCDGISSAFILDDTYVPVTIEVDTNDVATTDTGSVAEKQKIKDRLRDLHTDSTVQALLDDIQELIDQIKALEAEMERLIMEGEGLTPEQFAELARLKAELKAKQEQLEQKIRESRQSGPEIIMGTDNFIQGNFKVYPNPYHTSGDLLITHTEAMSQIMVYNTLGKLVYSKPVPDQMKIRLNLSELHSGQYAIQMLDKEGNTYYGKLLITE